MSRSHGGGPATDALMIAPVLGGGDGFGTITDQALLMRRGPHPTDPPAPLIPLNIAPARSLDDLARVADELLASPRCDLTPVDPGDEDDSIARRHWGPQ